MMFYGNNHQRLEPGGSYGRNSSLQQWYVFYLKELLTISRTKKRARV